ncbi:MAG TPA: BMP family ABC transporter substrate-binding protein [Firmicutes bacterium]|jgi:basic membrane protein A and related proteins|nr:BMP family ABC transporter substrate-binding protein [Bacillota bacterium]
MRKLSKAGLLFICIALIAVGVSAGYAADSKFKVAFMYVGPVGDAGWTFSHDLGRKYLAKTLPNVETTFVESVPEGADAERVLADLAEKGNKVIFATSYGYMDPVIKVAARYPNVVFMHCSGYKTAKNAGTYMDRDYEGRYLGGVAAAKYIKSNLVGYVAAYPTPEVVRCINAFTLGAQSINPQVKVKVVWTNTWYDPAAEKAAAMSLINAGAGFITMNQDTPAATQAAEEKGLYAVSNDSDMRAFAPKAIITGQVGNWGPYYVKLVKSVMNKTWKSSQYWGGLKDGMVGLSPYGSMVTPDVKNLVEKKKAALMKDDWAVFAGPIKDQSGNIKVKAGQKMTDQEMASFNWFVQGIEGTIPKQ